MNTDTLISIGELADMYSITKRTLRLYQDKGLLTPIYVNPDTGYRYYAASQLPRLDLIMQMKNVGLSLAQILEILNTQDLSLFEAILGEQIDKINEQIFQLKNYRHALQRRLESCKSLRNPPVLFRPFLEYYPRRTAYLCPIPAYDLEVDYHGDSPWKTALAQVRSNLLEKDMPLALFQQVGCVTSYESLISGHYFCNEAFIFFEEDSPGNLPISYIPASTYACVYNRYEAMNNFDEVKGIRLLMDYIQETGYEAAGPCYLQILVDAAIFNSSNEVLTKQQIAVRPMINKNET